MTRSHENDGPQSEHRRGTIVVGSPIDKITAALSQLADSEHRTWRKLLGNRLDEMLESREATQRLTADPNPEVRRGAFSIIARHWKPDPELEEVYRKAVISDPDSDVRAAALCCLSGLYGNSTDREVSTVFVKIVRESSNALSLRRAAYLGLCKVQGITVPGELIGLIYRQTEGLPEELDWPMVESFLK